MLQDASEHTSSEETLIVHCGKKPVIPHGDISMDAVPAVHVSTSYLFDSAESLLQVSRGQPGYVYRRYGNENAMELSISMCQLECAESAVCVSCGMGAVSSSLLAAGVLTGGKKVLGPYSCYGSTYTLMKSRFADIAACEFADMGNTAQTIDHIQRLKPDILYMETSSNPLTVVPDIALYVQEAKRNNPECITIIDNTYATPLLVKPLTLGVDVVVHSLTKYVNGHGDALAGIILSNNKQYMSAAEHVVIDFGTCLSPWDAWLVQRGLRTLGVRMETIGANALKIARHLSTLQHSSTVSRVWYPGLPSHPHFQAVLKNASRQYSEREQQEGFAFSGIISFDINVPEELGDNAARVFLDSMRLVSNQVSLGDVKTLASAPGLSTQQQVPLAERKLTGIRSTTIRLSIGMEKWTDICSDIDQALGLAVSKASSASSSFSPVDEASSVTLAQSATAPAPVPAVRIGDDATTTAAATPSASVHRTKLVQRSSRIKALYDQMSDITQEIEELQLLIKQDNLALLNNNFD